MEVSEIKETVEKILSLKKEKSIQKNLKRFGEFLAQRGVLIGGTIKEVIYVKQHESSDDRFMSFTSGYVDGTSQRLEKVKSDLEMSR